MKEEQLPFQPAMLSIEQRKLLKRVKRALNAGMPVVLDWYVDFNALDKNGIFALDTLKNSGPGRQGGHSTVIEDYVVAGVNPKTGKSFEVGEGEATPEQKELAEKYGQIKYFIVKNSWGGAARTDRASYVVNGEKGFHRLDASYVFGYFKRVNEKSKAFVSAVSGADAFILPPGF